MSEEGNQYLLKKEDVMLGTVRVARVAFISRIWVFNEGVIEEGFG